MRVYESPFKSLEGHSKGKGSLLLFRLFVKHFPTSLQGDGSLRTGQEGLGKAVLFRGNTCTDAEG